MDFLNNAWVVGTGGGILSGLTVTWISRFMFSKKENGIYIQNLRSANNEVIYALRPAISENKFPSIEIIDALIEANCRKFKVEKRDMYNVKQIAEELTKEIMDTSFISYDKKQELFQHLINLYKEEVDVIKDTAVKKDMEVLEYKKRLLNIVTSMLGIMTTGLVFAITMLSFYSKEINNIFNLNDLPKLRTLLMMLITSIAIISSSMATFNIDKFAKRKKDKEINNINNINNRSA